MSRLSINSSDINIFTQIEYDYELALKNCGYKTKLLYKTTDETFNVRNRSKKILCNMAVAYKLRKEFFRLLKKNFPLSNKLYKIFNKNTVKLNYYMPNVSNLINKSNTEKLYDK